MKKIKSSDYSLGKLPAFYDPRNLKFEKFIKKDIGILPESFNNEKMHKFKLKMYGNDKNGDCAIVAETNQVQRFEFIDQKKPLTFNDEDVLKQYFYQTGGEDCGIIMADSLKIWKNEGIKLNNTAFKIFAYLYINPRRIEHIKYAIKNLTGLQAGIWLPKSASTQIDNNQIWDVVAGIDSEAGSWGGHAVYICGYNKIGPICITWAQYQQMTWPFAFTYIDELYAVGDEKTYENSCLDVDKIKNSLYELSEG